MPRSPRNSTRNEMKGTRSLVLNGELFLYGVVDPVDLFGDGDNIRAIDVMASLAELRDQDEVRVRINSPGGSVTEGIAIFNALRAHGKRIVVQIDSMAASIASVIAMAGDEIIIADNATIMIHDPWGMAIGNSEDLREIADEIDRQKGILVNIYAQRTGLEVSEIEALMAAETYMSAAEAVEKGFADRIAESLQVAACAPLDSERLAQLLLLRPSSSRASRPAPAAPAAQLQESTRMPRQNPNQAAAGDTAAAVDTAPENTAVAPAPAAAAPAPAASAPAAVADVRAQASAPATGTVDVQAAIQAERRRVADIQAAVRAARLEPEFADSMIADGISVSDAHARIINRWAEVQNQAQGSEAPARPHGGGSPARVLYDGVDRWVQGATAGLLARIGLEGGERNEFSSMTLSEMARSSLQLRNIAPGSNRMAMVGTAFTVRANGPGYHSTSDFGYVLGTAARRSMLVGYEEIAETFPLWTSRGQLPDFRVSERIDLGLFPSLEKVDEGAEYKYGTVGDTNALIQLATYGRMFAITRQAIINDDLQMFDRLPRRMGRAARRTIGNLVYAILNGNPVMQDGTTLFHANHGNLASVAAAISVTSISAARAAMARQTGDPANGVGAGVRPRFLIVPPELELTAQTIMTAANTPGDAAQTPNPVRGLSEVIADSRLSGTAWYQAADPVQTDTIEVAYLDGNDQPELDQRDGWNVDGTEFKVRIDAGVKALHWRGLFKNAGA